MTMGKNKSKVNGHITPDQNVFGQQLDFMLHSTGHLFPVTPQQVDAFEKLVIHHELPPDFDDTDAILRRIEEKK
jgi:hypothetical protein